MAKIFRTEELSIGADNIRLTATSDGQFSFKKADGTEMLSNTSMDAEITSLNNKLDGIVSDRKDNISDKVSDLGVATTARVSDIAAKDDQLTSAINARTTNISSLNTKLEGFASDRVDDIADKVSDLGVATTARISDIAAKDAQLTSAISARSANITSLNTKLEGFASDRVDAIADSVSDLGVATTARTGNIASLANMIGSEDVFAARYTLDSHQGDSTFTANWDGDFLPETDPVVCAMLRGTSASDPILGVMISGAQTDLKTGAHFAFSDELPNNNYELEILVSKLP